MANDLTNVAKLLKQISAAVDIIKATPGVDLTPYQTTAQANAKYIAAADKDSIISTASSNAKAAIDAAIKTLVGAAPETLDTLAEIATAIGNDENLQKTIKGAIDNKADKTDLNAHVNNAAIHLTTAQAAMIADAATKEALQAHISDKVAHITATERTTWNAKANATDVTITDSATKTWVDEQVAASTAH